MPVLSWGHSHYWAGAAGAAPPDVALGSSAGGGYVPWMATITKHAGLLGGLLAVRWAPSR